MKKQFSLFLILFLISCSPRQDTLSHLSGKLLGDDGKPMKNASIAFHFIGQSKPVSFTLEKDGSYEVNIDHIGSVTVVFSGEKHRSIAVPSLLSEPERIEMNVRLSSENHPDKTDVQFADTSSLSARYHAVREWLEPLKKENNPSQLGNVIFARINGEQDADTQSLLCFLYMKNFFNTPEVDPDKVKGILQIVPPSSIVWTLWPDLPLWFSFILPPEDRDRVKAYIGRIADESPYQPVRAEAINYFLSLAEMESDSAAIQRYYKRLITECPESFRARDARFKYEILAPGKPVPPFQVTSIDEPGNFYNDKNLLGKVYLMDFWETKCGFCQAELPFLQEAYDKFKEKGFEIISLSMDDSLAVVKTFRQGRWKMPWFNALLEGGYENEIAKRFGVRGVPTPILVGTEGKIVATGNQVRQKNLLATLKKVLESSEYE